MDLKSKIQDNRILSDELCSNKEKLNDHINRNEYQTKNLDKIEEENKWITKELEKIKLE